VVSTTLAAEAAQFNFTRDLGEFVAGLDFARLSEAVRIQAVMTVLDTLGCSLAGTGVEDAERLLAAESARGGAGEAQVVGSAQRLPAEAATRVNAYQGDIFELNDLTGGHAGIAAVPTALALGEALGASGQAVLEAVVAAVEVTSRIYAAYYSDIKPFTETGMAPPGIPSTFGAAAAAARLLGLDGEGIGRAIAIAGALASWCPAEVIFGDGGTIKPMLFGAMPGSVGIMAARYAAEGLSGPPRILDSAVGFYATVARAFDPAALADDTTWHLAAPRRKLHACCGYIHSALDTVIQLRNEGVDVAGAREIRVGMPQYILPVISKPRAPTTPNEARFHAEYMLSLGAHGVDAILPEHSIGLAEWLKRPGVADLMGRVAIAADPGLAHYHHSLVEVVLADGSVVARKNLAPLGSPANPLDDAAVAAKFMRLAEPVVGSMRASALKEAIMALPEASDLKAVVALMGGR